MLALTSLLFVGCGKKQSTTPFTDAAPTLKVALMADGRFTVDGKEATLESLQSSLQGLAAKKGVIWYYRETLTTPPPNAAVIDKLMGESRVPTRYSSKPDYSDKVAFDGKPLK